jgi:hypothetical protein
MNLGELRTFVNNILDYSPSVQAYTNEVNNIINEIYLSHFTDRLWEYSQKEVRLSVYADNEASFTAQADGSLITAGGNGAADWVSWGHTAEILSASNPVGNVEVGKEYHISYREDIAGDTRVFLEEKGKQGYSSQYGAKDRALTTTAGDTFKIKFKQREITLPEDCVELVGLGLRERGSGIRSPFEVLPRWTDENLALDLDLVALPTDVIMEQPFSMMPPVNDPQLATRAAATNTVDIAGNYEVAYTIIHRSRTADTIVELESAPFFSTGSFAFAVGDTIKATNLEITDDNPRTAYQEYLKRVYVKGPNSSHFYRAADGPNAEFDNEDDNNGDGLFAFQFAHKTEARLPEHGGTYQRCRLYPRQDKNYEATFRYQYRPIILRDDTDTPQMPADSHRYLAYRACQELFMKHGNVIQSQAYQQKADKELLKIENRYLRTKGATHIKGPYRTNGQLFGRPQIKITRN